MADELQRDLDEFAAFFAAHRRQTDVTRSDSRIAKTLHWLLSRQSTTGQWGNEDVATTALAALALQSLSQPTNGWEVASKVSSSLKLAGSFLEEKYKQNQWEEAVWDTAVATRALLAIDADRHASFIRSRIDWLIRNTEARGNYGPHHIAQAILALISGATHRDVIAKRCTMLESLLDGNIEKYSPYVLGQCIQALCTGAPKSPLIHHIASALKSYIASVRLDSGNFLNICLALQGLWAAPGKRNLEGARIGVASLFGNTCFREGGSWYNHELMTAWALLTLADFSREVVLTIPYSEAVHELARFHEQVSMTYRRRLKAARLSISAQLGLAVLWSGILGSFITYSSLRPPLPGWSDELISALAVALIGLSIGRWLRLFHREPSSLPSYQEGAPDHAKD